MTAVRRFFRTVYTDDYVHFLATVGVIGTWVSNTNLSYVAFKKKIIWFLVY